LLWRSEDGARETNDAGNGCGRREPGQQSADAVSAVTTQENTPYVFQWSDFHVSDAQAAALSIDMSTWCQGGGQLEYLTSDGWELAANGLTVTKDDLDAGKLRFVPDQDATGYSGYGGTGLGNLQSIYTLFTYSAFDGGTWSDNVDMNIDVVPVATAPTLSISGQRRSPRPRLPRI
jgi:surface adhesion protein